MQRIHITINQKSYDLLVNPEDTLATVIREKAGLTGTKIGCEQGSCGACTVVSDGKPVLSCIAPAIRFDGLEVETIEGVETNGKLHPVQEKFIEKGALQCGYCTPGMIMTAKSFLEKNPNPTIDEIKESISGNLCRCTGYKKIIEAIDEAAKEIQGKIPAKTKSKVQSGVVGNPTPIIESREKVTGKAMYADDYKLAGTLHCKLLRSTHAHAKILDIDISEAEKIPGVRAIITGKELPEKFGVLPISQDQNALAIDKVRFIGEIVVAVAADTEAIAAQAIQKIKVHYQPIQEFFKWEDALKPAKGEQLIHSYSAKYGYNLHKKAELRFGDQEKDFETSEYVVEDTFDFIGANHAFTEPHACVAWWEKGDNLTIISATQVPHYLHRALSKVLKTPLSKIRVIKPVLGGGFGGKSDPFPHEMITAHLARKTGKPVKIRFSREEVFLTNHGRHPTHLTMKLGMDKTGKFKSLDADIVIDGGAYGSFGVVTTYYNGVLLQAPYQLDSFGFETKRVYTNKPQCGAMRGHGAVNPRYAAEVIIDELAEKSGMDPVELRLRNFLNENSFTLGQYRITSNGIGDAIKTVRDQSGWKDKYGKLPFGHGIGVACGFFISGSALPIIWNEYPQSVVHLKLDFDGRVVIYSGASDIGQGSDTMLAMIVAEVLGISVDQTYVHAADTLFTPVDLGSYSSRVTFMAGNAAKMAAEKLREEIFKSIEKKFNLSGQKLYLENGKIKSETGDIELTWEEAVVIATNFKGAINTSGYYNSPKLGGDFKGAGAGLSPSYSFGAMVCEVKVDLDTGQVKVLDMWGAHDLGKAINPLSVEGQLEGSWHMGMGQAVSEAMNYYEGLQVNNNFIDYKIPTSKDIPEIHTNIIESGDPEGPFGAKECGEGALHPSIPAIANAVYDAVGVRIKSLPIDPETIRNSIDI
jgi:4-hydroxybenzoyl-CoA reductase subunit alpha